MRTPRTGSLLKKPAGASDVCANSFPPSGANINSYSWRLRRFRPRSTPLHAIRTLLQSSCHARHAAAHGVSDAKCHRFSARTAPLRTPTRRRAPHTRFAPSSPCTAGSIPQWLQTRPFDGKCERSSRCERSSGDEGFVSERRRATERCPREAARAVTARRARAVAACRARAVVAARRDTRSGFELGSVLVAVRIIQARRA
jgi:hypothetical protein